MLKQRSGEDSKNTFIDNNWLVILLKKFKK